MLKSSNQEYFFETDVSQAKREQRKAKAPNKFGNPIVLKSKILAAVLDPREPSSCIYVAEAAGFVRRVNVDTGAVTATFSGPTAPLTSLTLSPDGGTIYAGCWDGSIWGWTVAQPTSSGRRTTTAAGAADPPKRLANGHTDFVKTVLCVPYRGSGSNDAEGHLVVSGGADRKLVVWDPETGRRLYALQDEGGGGGGDDGGSDARMLALQCLALDPSSVASPGGGASSAAVVVSGSSDPAVRRWRIGRESGRLESWGRAGSRKGATRTGGEEEEGKAPVRRLVVHDTSVYHLAFDTSDYDDDEEGALPSVWTASADGTAKLISSSPSKGGVVVEETLQHGDYVRAVAATDRWVLTAGRSEDVKVWDRASGEQRCGLEGHYDEVTDLVVLKPAGGKQRLVSVGLDGTVRTWPLDERGLDEEVKRQADARRRLEEGGAVADADDEKGDGAKKKQGNSGLTAEEEAELAALMGENDD